MSSSTLTQPDKPESAFDWLYQEAMQLVPYATVLCDAQVPDTPIVYVDERFEASTGYTRAEVMGKNPRFLHRDDDDQPGLLVVREAIRNARDCTVTLRNYRKDGTLFWNELRIAPVYRDGALRYFVAMQRDVTSEIEAAEVREAYRKLVDNTTQAMAIITAAGIVFVNPAFTAILGYSLADVQALSAENARTLLFHPDDRDEAQARFEQVMQGQLLDPLSIVVRLRTKAGHDKWADVSAVPITYQGARSIQLTITDITQSYQMQSELAQREELFRSVLEQSNDGITVVDADGIVIIWNAAQERITGLSSAAAIGQHLFDVPSWAGASTPEGPDKILARRDTALRDMIPQALAGEDMPWMRVPLSTTITHRDGTQRAIQSVIFPIDSARGRLLGSVTRDVTADKALADQLRRSERRHKLLSEVTLEGLVIQRDGLIIDANTRFLQMFGLNLTHITGQHIAAQIATNGYSALVREHIANKYQGTYEIMAKTARGTVFPAEVDVRQLDDHTRVASIRDITERKAAEAALRASESRLRAAADNFPDALIMLLDRELRILMLRGPLMERLGWVPDKAKGQLAVDVLGQTLCAKLIPVFIGTLNGAEHALEYEYRGLTLQVQSVPILDDDSALNVAMVVVQDITKRIAAQQSEFMVALEQERVRLLRQFIEAAAHEFRTPLSIIHVNAHIMQVVDDPNRRREALNVIAMHIEMLTQLVQMLLMMVKLDSETYTFETLSLTHIINQVCHFHKTRTRSHTVMCEVSDGLPLVAVNMTLLEEALKAIIDNACRYSPEGSTITLRGYQDDDEHVSITVSDTGIGIKAEDQKRIFDSFWRADSARTTAGLGLGLPYARKVILRHHGTLTVESTPDVGSTFIIRLPIATSAPPSFG